MALGRLHRCELGCGDLINAIAGAGSLVTTFAMAAVDACWAARFTAGSARDVKGGRFSWSAVSAPGTVQFTVETIDATTRKPTGTPYTGAASKDFPPAAGSQLVLFDALPTAGLTPGTEYALVLTTIGAGTTQTLRPYWGPIASRSVYPVVAFTAADGVPRSGLTESAGSIPICSIVYEDDSEEAAEFLPYDSTVSTNTIYGTRAFGAYINLQTSVKVAGVVLGFVLKTNNPTGNLRVRIIPLATADDTPFTGAEAIAHVTSVTSIHARSMRVFFPAPVTLPAGIYRVVIDQTDHASTSGNNWALRTPVALDAAVAPSGFMGTFTADIDAATIDWDETPKHTPPLSLLIDDLVVAAGGGTETFTGTLINRGIQ